MVVLVVVLVDPWDMLDFPCLGLKDQIQEYIVQRGLRAILVAVTEGRSSEALTSRENHSKMLQQTSGATVLCDDHANRAGYENGIQPLESPCSSEFTHISLP